MKKTLIVILILFFAVLTACKPDAVPSPTPSEEPTLVVEPTGGVTTAPPPSGEITPDPHSPLEITTELLEFDGFKAERPEVDEPTGQASLINEYFENRTGKFADAFDPGETDSYEVSYQTGYNHGGIVSYKFSVVTAYTDARTMEKTTETVYIFDTVDYNAGVRVTTDDLFAAGKEIYLERITLSEDEQRFFDPELIFLTGDALCLHYPPRTVSDGWQVVEIPLKDLSDILADWVVYG